MGLNQMKNLLFKMNLKVPHFINTIYKLKIFEAKKQDNMSWLLDLYLFNIIFAMFPSSKLSEEEG
jgi:hypothetical protein